MARSSRITFSSAAAAAMADDEEIDEEPGEAIESLPPLLVGEERVINSSGLTKKLLKAGRGRETPNLGDEATVHYVGMLIDGSKFDSSRDRGHPQTFKLGHGEIVTGLDNGIITVRKGETALFTIPSAWGYGNIGAEGVPPSADIRFEVELISWLTVVDICKDGGTMKKVMLNGDGGQTSDLDEVTVKYQVMLVDGSIVAKAPEGRSQFYVNEGHLCPALPKVLKTMKRGEKACVTVQPQFRYTAMLEDATVFEKSGFNGELFELFWMKNT